MHLGRVPYAEALALQHRVRAARQASAIPDTVLLLEHPPVYTRGRRSVPGELPFGEDYYATQGIEIVDVDRGGKVTYHGPGQLVAYPIVAITDVMAFVSQLEQVMVDALRDGGCRGPWSRHRWPRLHRRLGRRAQDRLDRPARLPRRDDARAEPQRRRRPDAVSVDRPVRAGRRGDDLRRGAEHRTRSGRLDCLRKRVALGLAEALGARQRLVTPQALERALDAAPSPVG